MSSRPGRFPGREVKRRSPIVWVLLSARLRSWLIFTVAVAVIRRLVRYGATHTTNQRLGGALRHADAALDRHGHRLRRRTAIRGTGP
jgi:hypothetical protein